VRCRRRSSGPPLAREYAVAVTFRETTTVCVERLVGTGEAVEVIDTESNPFLATVGLRLEPGPRDSGFRFGLEVEPGSMPPAFFTAVEESARASLRRGLHGWEVLDCRVTMTRSGYWARQSHAHGTFDASMSSTAGDFRGLTRLVLQQALRDAGTRVEEPIHEVELEVPADTIGTTMRALAQVRGVPLDSRVSGTSYLVTGEVHVLGRLLPTLTRGEGVLVSRFARHRAVRGAVPIRS
jgi:ribosomal protection tetracycline resistance protein